MVDFLLDDTSLLVFAKAIQARQEALETGANSTDADAAFKSVLWMDYSTDQTISALEEFSDLTYLLIKTLELKKAGPSEAYTEAFDSYEMLRILAASDYIGLRINR